MFSKEEEAPVLELVKLGLPPKEIQKRLPDATEHLIRKVKINLGLRLRRGRPKWSKPEIVAKISEMRKLKAAGHTYEAIGIKFGMTKQGVHAFLKIHDPIPPGSACSKCGSTVRKIHRHHTDYITDEYVLMCASCHTKEHLPTEPRTRRQFRAGISPTRKRLALCKKILEEAAKD